MIFIQIYDIDVFLYRFVQQRVIWKQYSIIFCQAGIRQSTKSLRKCIPKVHIRVTTKFRFRTYVNENMY